MVQEGYGQLGLLPRVHLKPTATRVLSPRNSRRVSASAALNSPNRREEHAVKKSSATVKVAPAQPFSPFRPLSAGGHPFQGQGHQAHGHGLYQQQQQQQQHHHQRLIENRDPVRVGGGHRQMSLGLQSPDSRMGIHAKDPAKARGDLVAALQVRLHLYSL